MILSHEENSAAAMSSGSSQAVTQGARRPVIRLIERERHLGGRGKDGRGRRHKFSIKRKRSIGRFEGSGNEEKVDLPVAYTLPSFIKPVVTPDDRLPRSAKIFPREDKEAKTMRNEQKAGQNSSRGRRYWISCRLTGSTLYFLPKNLPRPNLKSRQQAIQPYQRAHAQPHLS